MRVGFFICVDLGIIKGIYPLAKSEDEIYLKEYAAKELQSVKDALTIKNAQVMFATINLDSLPLLIHKDSPQVDPLLN